MSDSEPLDQGRLFATTRWSVVLAARDGVMGDATAALETLCKTYWRSLYGYARRQGYSPHDSEDLAQAFFARLLEREYLQAVRQERGPFRAFLQMAFKRFLLKERDRSAALRRGGGVPHLSFDLPGAESAYEEVAPEIPADEVFERRWAMTVLATVMQRLREEYQAAGRQEDFDVLKAALSTPKEGIRCAEMATALHSSEGATRVAVHRLRKRFRELFRAEVAQTVVVHEDVDEEVRHLVDVLARS